MWRVYNCRSSPVILSAPGQCFLHRLPATQLQVHLPNASASVARSSCLYLHPSIGRSPYRSESAITTSDRRMLMMSDFLSVIFRNYSCSTTITAAHASILLATCGSDWTPMNAGLGRALDRDCLSHTSLPFSVSSVASQGSHGSALHKHQSNHHPITIQSPSPDLSPSHIVLSSNLAPHSSKRRASRTSAETTRTNYQKLHETRPFHNCPFCGCNPALE